MIIALDAMGGDNAPGVEVRGAVMALKEIEKLKILLVGKKELINKELLKHEYDRTRIEIVHTDEYIKMSEDVSPAMAVRKKKNASMNIMLDLVKEGKADGSVSAGNTGALMTASQLKLKRIKGVLRPAIAANLPAKNGNIALLDAGANSDCKAEYINQFATMGSIYAEVLFKKPNPKIGLLNIGTEEGKGNELTVSSFELLKNNRDINFIGNVEGKEMMNGEVDVLVADGFTGNMVLKTAEGVATFVMELIKEAFKSNILGKAAALLMAPALKKMKKKMDYSEYGGAIFLGINGISIKSHGGSDAVAIKNGIRVAALFAENNFVEHLREKFAENS